MPENYNKVLCENCNYFREGKSILNELQKEVYMKDQNIMTNLIEQENQLKTIEMTLKTQQLSNGKDEWPGNQPFMCNFCGLYENENKYLIIEAKNCNYDCKDFLEKKESDSIKKCEDCIHFIKSVGKKRAYEIMDELKPGFVTLDPSFSSAILGSAQMIGNAHKSYETEMMIEFTEVYHSKGYLRKKPKFFNYCFINEKEKETAICAILNIHNNCQNYIKKEKEKLKTNQKKELGKNQNKDMNKKNWDFDAFLKNNKTDIKKENPESSGISNDPIQNKKKVCTICNNDIFLSDGLMLAPDEAKTNKIYWQSLINNEDRIKEHTIDDPRDLNDHFLYIAEAYSNDNSSIFMCENCAKDNFNFDYHRAKLCSLMQTDRSDLLIQDYIFQLMVVIAAEAWHDETNSWPRYLVNQMQYYAITVNPDIRDTSKNYNLFKSECEIKYHKYKSWKRVPLSQDEIIKCENEIRKIIEKGKKGKKEQEQLKEDQKKEIDKKQQDDIKKKNWNYFYALDKINNIIKNPHIPIDDWINDMIKDPLIPENFKNTLLDMVKTVINTIKDDENENEKEEEKEENNKHNLKNNKTDIKKNNDIYLGRSNDSTQNEIKDSIIKSINEIIEGFKPINEKALEKSKKDFSNYFFNLNIDSTNYEKTYISLINYILYNNDDLIKELDEIYKNSKINKNDIDKMIIKWSQEIIDIYKKNLESLTKD